MLVAVQSRRNQLVAMVGASGLDTSVPVSALVVAYLYVLACKCFSFVVQYAVDVLVRTIVIGVFLGKAFPRIVYLRWNMRRRVLFVGIQRVPIF